MSYSERKAVTRVATNKGKWSARRARVDWIAESLALELGRSLPTALVKIARKRGVRIEFRPLLVDGGISVEPDGFKIYLHCKKTQLSDFQSRLERDDTGRFLPARARFTLAHEIAHTLFFDLKNGRPVSIVDFTDRRSLIALEKACHRAALHMLFPEALFHQDYRQADLLDPLVLRTLTSRAKISAPALVQRFRQFKTFPHPFGIVATVHCQEHDFTISAISRHEGCRDVFCNAKPGAPLSALIADPDFSVYGGNKPDVLMHPFQQENRRFRFHCEEGTRGVQRTLFVTARPQIE